MMCLAGSQVGLLAYGIEGLEALGRDPKQIINLENPGQLTEYLVSTAESLEELVTIKDTFLGEGQFRPKRPYGKDEVNAKKTLAQPLLIVANELADRLKDVDPRKVDTHVSDKEFRDVYTKWMMRLDAHAAVVIAFQAKGKYPVNKAALEALAKYEALAGTYQADWFAIDLMREYFNIKYSAGKLSTGEVPENLKADPDKVGFDSFRRETNWDQEFRRINFGVKEPELRRYERQRVGQDEKERQKRERQRIEDFVNGLFKDPWEANAKYLKILGLDKEMTYDAARAAFRKTITQYRVAFSMAAKEKGTPAYENAMKAAGEVLEAWRAVEPLYKEKQPNQEPEPVKREEPIQPQPRVLS